MPKPTMPALQPPGTDAPAPEDVDKRAAMWASLSGEPMVAQPSKRAPNTSAQKAKKQKVTTREGAKRSVEDRSLISTMQCTDYKLDQTGLYRLLTLTLDYNIDYDSTYHSSNQ